MKINQILQNKIISIIAMIGLLYFLFQSTKDNPRAITNQISGNNLQKNLNAASKKLPSIATIKKLKSDNDVNDETSN